MLIGVNIGHIGTVGAVGFLDELECNKQIAEKLIPMLESVGHTVVDCSVPRFGGVEDYVLSTIHANKHQLDFLISIHCNSYTDPYAHGTEVLYPPRRSSRVAASISERISKKLGTYDRGPKAGTVYLVRNAKANCVLVESFFVSNKRDCDKYNPTLIAEGIAEEFGWSRTNQNGGLKMSYLERKYEYCDDNIPHGLKNELQEAIDMGIITYGDEGFKPPLSENDVRTLVWIKRGVKR